MVEGEYIVELVVESEYIRSSEYLITGALVKVMRDQSLSFTGSSLAP